MLREGCQQLDKICPNAKKESIIIRFVFITRVSCIKCSGCQHPAVRAVSLNAYSNPLIPENVTAFSILTLLMDVSDVGVVDPVSVVSASGADLLWLQGMPVFCNH